MGSEIKIAVIGCGVMGSAFAKHFAKQNHVILCDHNAEHAEKLAKSIHATAAKTAAEAMSEADIILLAVKPKDLSKVASDLADKTLISILAGTSVNQLKAHFPKMTVVRTMPNLALTCGEGVIGLVENNAITAATKTQINTLLHGLGLNVWLPENKIDALTAVTGSGIGFVLLMIEAMMDGSVFLGLNVQESREFVLKAFTGAAALMQTSGKHPAQLRNEISSPGGTTIAGLRMMEKKGIPAGIIDTLIECYEKAIKMSQDNTSK